MAVRSILAAVGRFPQDEAVLARALEISKTLGAALTIAHVVDLPGHDPVPGGPDTLQGQAALAAKDRIGAVLAGLGADSSAVDISIETGSPALRLIEICERQSPDVIVMRAHQKDRVSRQILGSTTDRLIAAGLVPVLVVKRPVRTPYARVLLATDGTDDASGALSFVAALLTNAALHLVRAVHVAPQLEEAMLRVGTDQAALTAHREALNQIASDHLRSLAAKSPRPATARVLNGDPATALVRATRGPNVDLIAIGPGRTSLIRRAFIGSVTRRLLRDAACDVLVCRPLTTG